MRKSSRRGEGREAVGEKERCSGEEEEKEQVRRKRRSR